MNAYQNHDQCTGIRRTGAAHLLLYALITTQRVTTNVYTIFIQGFAPHMRQKTCAHAKDIYN